MVLGFSTHAYDSRGEGASYATRATGGVAHWEWRDHTLLTHGGAKKVARLGDLAVVAQKQPAAGEDPFQLLLVDLRFNEDASTDQAMLGIHQTLCVRHHGTPPYAVLGCSAELSMHAG